MGDTPHAANRRLAGVLFFRFLRYLNFEFFNSFKPLFVNCFDCYLVFAIHKFLFLFALFVHDCICFELFLCMFKISSKKINSNFNPRKLVFQEKF